MEGGKLRVLDGAVVSGVRLESAASGDSGYISLEGGSAADVTLDVNTRMYVYWGDVSRVSVGSGTVIMVEKPQAWWYGSRSGYLPGDGVKHLSAVTIASGGDLRGSCTLGQVDCRDVTVLSGGSLFGFTFGSDIYIETLSGISGGTVVSGGTGMLLAGMTGENLTVCSGGNLFVGNGCSVSDVTIRSGGMLRGFSFASDVTLSDLEHISCVVISSGMTGNIGVGIEASDIRVCSGGSLVVSFDGMLSGVEVSSGAQLIVSSGAMVSAVTLHSGASYYANNSWTVASADRYISGGIYDVVSGETVSGVTLDEFATMRVASGGMALDVEVIRGGTLSVESGAVVSGIFNGGGGSICVASGATAYIESSVAANWLQANERCVSSASGAIVSYTEAQDGIIYRRGRMNNGRSYLKKTGLAYLENMVVGGDDVYAASGTNLDQYLLLSGCSARDVTVIGRGAYGGIYVCSGASAERITLGSEASNVGALVVLAGGSATDVTAVGKSVSLLVNGGHVSGFDGCGQYITVTSQSGDFQQGSYLLLPTYAVGGVGVLEDARFTSGAMVSAYSSGVLSSWSAESGAKVLAYSGGTACDGTLSGGEMLLSFGGVASNTTVLSGGVMSALAGAKVTGTVVSGGGNAVVSSGASAVRVSITSGGNALVYDGATLTGLSLENGGVLVVSGCKEGFGVQGGGLYRLNGAVLIGANAVLDMHDGEVCFDLTGREASEDAIVSDLEGIRNAEYTITVTNDQATGMYLLAENAYSFSGSITLYCGDEEDGHTLRMERPVHVEANGIDYLLMVTETGALVLDVADTTAPDISITAEPAEGDTLSVTLTATADDGSPIWYNTVAEDYAGTWQRYEGSVTATANGVYYFKAIDAAGNESTAEVSVENILSEAADLAVTAVQAKRGSKTATTFGTGDKITVSFTVTNQGDGAPNSASRVYLLIDGDQEGTGKRIAKLAVGASTSGSFTIDADYLTPGDYTLTVVADPENAVLERNKVNNRASITIRVEDDNACDMVVDAISLVPSTIGLEEQAEIRFTIANIGEVDAEKGSCAKVYLGEKLLKTVAVEALESGGSADFTVTVDASEYGLETGSHLFRVVADAEEELEESDEANNSASAYLRVTAPDLAIRSFQAEDECAAGEKAVMRFTVRNQGGAASAATTAYVTCGRQRLATIDIAALNAGAQRTYECSFDTTGLEAGDLEIKLTLDPKNAVAESDEANNSATAMLTVIADEDEAPVITEVTAVQAESGYGIALSAKVTDDYTDASRLSYFVQYGFDADACDAAPLQSGTAIQLDETAAGRTLHYRLWVQDAAGNRSASGMQTLQVADHTAPMMASVSARVDGQKVTLAWSAADNVGVAKYRIYIDESDASPVVTAEVPGSATSWQSDELAADKSHTYRVVAVDAAGNTSEMAKRSVYVGDSEAPVIAAATLMRKPGQPYAYMVNVAATDNVTAGGQLSYAIRLANSEKALEGAIPVAGNEFTLEAADAGKRLWWQVGVTDQGGNTAWSDVQSVLVPDMTAPEVVKGLKATTDGGDVAVQWTPGSDNVCVTGYNVRYASWGNWNVQDGVTSTGFTLAGLAAGSYTWQVQAVDAAGNASAWSAEAAFTVFAADSYEANDTAATATSVGRLDGLKSYAATIHSATDQDWYKIELGSRGSASDYLRLDMADGSGNLDIYVYAGDGGRLVAYSATTASSETISLDGFGRGTYYVQVLGRSGAQGAYTLEMRQNAAYTADAFEENDTVEAATILNTKTAAKGSYALNLHTESDVDYFRVTLANMGGANDVVSITFKNSVADLDLDLYDASGTLVASSTGVGDSESISLEGMAAGNYTVKVSGSGANEYTLNYTILATDPGADALEASEPVHITESTAYDSLTISPTGGDAQDTFVITLTQTGTAANRILLEAERSEWNGLQYTLSDAAGNTLSSGVGYELSLEGFAAGDYTLTVDSPVAGSYGGYGISVNVDAEEQVADSGWAVFLYVDGDNNLDGGYLYDLVKMQQARLDAGVEVYVMYDRSADAPTSWGSITAGTADSSSTLVGRLRYSSGTSITIDWEDWGERNMGSISTLHDFLAWGSAQTDAANYALVLKDHGTSFGYICSDVTSGNSMLTITQIAKEVAAWEKLSVTVFDACLMGSDVVVSAMEGSCDYVVASEAIGWSPDLTVQYDDLLGSLTGDMDAKAFATAVVASNGGRSTYYTTLAAFDTSDSAISDALDAFAAASAGFTTADMQKIANAFGKANNYTESDVVSFSDVVSVMKGAAVFGSKALKAAVSDLLEALETAVPATHAYLSSYGNGLAVFNPIQSESESVLKRYYYGNSYANNLNYYATAAGKSAWGQFLKKLATDYKATATISTGNGGMETVSAIVSNAEGASSFSVANLGVFSGYGVSFETLTIDGEAWFLLEMTQDGMENDAIRVTAADGTTALTLTLYDDTLAELATGTGTVSLAGVRIADTGKAYYLRVSSAEAVQYALSMDADWSTGVDRLDYAVDKRNIKPSGSLSTAGNCSSSKATSLGQGTYDGLVTHDMDADWYRIGNPYCDEYRITITSDNILRVTEEWMTPAGMTETVTYGKWEYNGLGYTTTLTVSGENYLQIMVDDRYASSYARGEDSTTHYRMTVTPVAKLNGSADGGSEGSGRSIAAPVLMQSILAPTNGVVWISADMPEGAERMEYSTDGGETWAAFEARVGFLENGTILVQALDAAGNSSVASSLTINNIDHTVPEVIITPSTEAWTREKVTLTVTASANGQAVTDIEYTLDGTAWTRYTGAIKVNANAKYTFRATSEVGNVGMSAYEVICIDRAAPTIVAGGVSDGAWTSEDVVVTADFSDNGALDSMAYRIGENGAWVDCSAHVQVTVGENTTVYFRATDKAGNSTADGAYKVVVDTIDKTAPVVAIDCDDSPTNQDVVVKAAFTDNVENGVADTFYRIGGNAEDDYGWMEYTAGEGVIMHENGSIWFKAVDHVGNAAITGHTITCIDREAPAAPTDITATPVEPTCEAVMVKATFSEDSALREYSLDGIEWRACPEEGACIEQNCTVYFRGKDAAGNISEVVSYTVTNIDRRVPAGPAVVLRRKSGAGEVLVELSWNDSENSGSCFYALDDGEWTLYTSPLHLTEEVTLHVRAQSQSGVYSVTESQLVTLSISEDEVVIVNPQPGEGGATGIQGQIDWSGSQVTVWADGYDVKLETSEDGSVTVAGLQEKGVELYNAPAGEMALNIRPHGMEAWSELSKTLTVSSGSGQRIHTASSNGYADLVFAKVETDRVWNASYIARNLVDGSTKNLDGLNIISDVVVGSEDATVLLLTDTGKGDALFLEDLYSDLDAEAEGYGARRLEQVDTILAGAGDDLVDLTGHQTVLANVTIRGGDGNDTIWVAGGSNRLFGDAGDDMLAGASGDDVMAGGAGDDTLLGNGGMDVFCFGGSWGSDVVTQLPDGDFRLWFEEGIAETDLQMTDVDGDTLVKRIATGDSITVRGMEAADVCGKILYGDGTFNGLSYGQLKDAGAFEEESSTAIFHKRDGGMLA